MLPKRFSNLSINCEFKCSNFALQNNRLALHFQLLPQHWLMTDLFKRYGITAFWWWSVTTFIQLKHNLYTCCDYASTLTNNLHYIVLCFKCRYAMLKQEVELSCRRITFCMCAHNKVVKKENKDKLCWWWWYSHTLDGCNFIVLTAFV